MNHSKINIIKSRLLQSNLAKDSFWAIFGNGIGNALLLVAGIIIARFLGKDVYGEYGFVKSTMFYIASFASLGLGVTSTKFIAQQLDDSPQFVKSVIKDSILLTIGFSGSIAILLFCFATPFAILIKEPSLYIAFRVLAIIIVFRAITTTQIGLLAGFKKFKTIAINGLLSGSFMLIICIPLTYYLGLKGSLCSLLLSQMFNAIINCFSIIRITKTLEEQIEKNYKMELFRFSLPVALQESSFVISHWGAIMLLTMYSSIGEVGLYTATAQWNSIIMMIPGLLNNVILSHLSSSVNKKDQHKRTITSMLLVNLASTLIPFITIYISAGFIASFYGPTFSEMPGVMRLLTFATIFECCSQIFKSELLAQSRVWLLFTLRLVRDIMLITSMYLVLLYFHGKNGAMVYSLCNVITSVLFFGSLIVSYFVIKKKSIK